MRRSAPLRSHRDGRSLVVLLVLVIVMLAGGGAYLMQRSQPGGGNGGNGELVNWSAAPAHDVTWTVTARQGELPWNNVVYLMVTEFGVETPYHARNLGNDNTILVRGAREGERWHLRSEQNPSPAEERMLWMIEDEGTITGHTRITVEAPPRTLLEVSAPASTEGIDYLVLYHEESGHGACGIRDQNAGLLFRVWSKERGHYYLLRQCPPRPWVCDEFAAGRVVVGARIQGRQWVVQRHDLAPGDRVVLPTADAPPGGGIVVCDQPDALLHFGGDRPLPAPRRADRDDLRFEARWEGVPPGGHALTYPDGRRVDVTVTDGETVRLPK